MYEFTLEQFATQTCNQNRDIIKDLEATLHYYENVAQVDDDHERAETLKSMKIKLQSIVASLSMKVQGKCIGG